MRNLLHKFLADWLAWAENGGEMPSPLGIEYGRDRGLCACTYQFTENASVTGYPTDSALITAYPIEAAIHLQDLLADAFNADHLPSGYPFGIRPYHWCAQQNTMHKDQNRLDWVRRQLAK